MNFLCVTEPSVPTITTESLKAACEARGVSYFEILPEAFLFDSEDRAGLRDLLYRPAISMAALRVEQFLFTPRAATFYALPDGPYFGASGSTEAFVAAGVPTPRMVPVLHAGRANLDRHVEGLGGYPVVLKVLGSSRGIGVMRADSAASLYSIVDYALAQGAIPMLMAFVPHATHWRVTVVGDRAIAAYINPEEDGDFRTYGSTDAGDFIAAPEGPLADVAIAAVRAQRLEFGGVDVLEHASGRFYVLESNFPCFFAQAHSIAGIDVAGAMLDHLIDKAHRIAREHGDAGAEVLSYGV